MFLFLFLLIFNFRHNKEAQLAGRPHSRPNRTCFAFSKIHNRIANVNCCTRRQLGWSLAPRDHVARKRNVHTATTPLLASGYIALSWLPQKGGPIDCPLLFQFALRFTFASFCFALLLLNEF